MFAAIFVVANIHCHIRGIYRMRYDFYSKMMEENIKI
jgi:hypothetical protein